VTPRPLGSCFERTVAALAVAAAESDGTVGSDTAAASIESSKATAVSDQSVHTVEDLSDGRARWRVQRQPYPRG
jgi:hypothetical protein